MNSMSKSAMGKSVDAVRSMTDRDVEGSDQKALAPKVISSPFWGHMGRSASVAGRLSRTLSRTFSLVDLDDVLYGEEATNRSQWRAVSRKRYAAAASVLVLAALMFTLLLRPSGRATSQRRSTSDVAQYLRGIAAWYDGQPRSSGSPSHDFYFGSCTKQVKLPEIPLPMQMPMAQTWQPEGVYPYDPLDELALNCSTLKDRKACNAALDASNSYDGDLPPLDPEDLAAHLMVYQDGENDEAASDLDPSQGLESLNLDCSADLAACAAAAERSNSYTGDAADADGLDAAAEAEAYLYMAQSPSGWDTIIGHAAQHTLEELQQPAADISYESSEHSWVQKRIAEEAAPQYVDAAVLDLDCGDEATDAAIANECERSREANRYETASQHACPPELQVQIQRADNGIRTVGYDVPCIEVDQSGSVSQKSDKAAKKPGCDCGAHAADATQEQDQQSSEAENAPALVMPAERLHALQLQLQPIVKLRRVTGYDVPAIDDEQELALLHARQQPAADAADTVLGVVSHRDELLKARLYYKNPCNDPGAHQSFKNRREGPMHRVYYKNPANAPVIIQEEIAEPAKQQAAAVCSNIFCKAASAGAALLPKVLGVVVALLGAAAGSWYIKTQNCSRKANTERVRSRERLHAGSRCFSSLANCPIYEESEEEGGELMHHHGSSSSQGLPSNPSGTNLLVPVSRVSSEVVPLSFPNPSLYTCASTIHESLFECAVDAAAAAAGAFSSLTTVRTSQMDDVPEPGLDSPRNTHSSTPIVEKKMAD